MMPTSLPPLPLREIQTRGMWSARPESASRTWRWVSMVAVLLVGAWPAPSWTQSTAEQDLARGVQLVRGGSCDEAIDPLNAAIRQFAPDPARSAQLARAYLYLAAAFVRLDQKVAARAAFTQALRADPVLTYDGEGFPGNVVKFFREARKDINLAALPPRPTPPPTPPPGDADIFAPSADAELERGVAQSRSGDALATATLDGVLTRVGAQPENGALRVRALLFLAVAHHSANREVEARSAVAELLKLRPGLTLPAGQFPVAFVQVFEAVKAAPPTP